MKFGLAGFVVGSSTGWVTDKVYGLVSPHLMSATPRSNVMQSALNAVVGGALVSVMVFAGDRVLESVMDMGNDPLFRTTYYQSAILSSSTARMVMGNIQATLNGIIPTVSGKSGQMPYAPMPVSKKNPDQEPGPVMQGPPSTGPMMKRAIPSCAAGSTCGSIMLLK